ncbi:uncharacterized protein LOC130738527 [Lotus japonicus]|uniref:uncharacterized protein LOC130738527 n=1 Tax=Lotus japonicus TaxID=34305 RepID=UPI0025853D3C|nr:uncharacterized protein LOC130738527 [Lotus japonicus]XP_057446505.1 uncharacterized protein LOC130738527 [Lotus japonicus]
MPSSISSETSSCSGGCSPSNLERLLQCVTPVVPSHTLPQSCLNDVNRLWQPLGKEKIEYFTLKDLWDCFNEWSAYGVGTPVTLESGDTVINYYVPYLSAIQLYTNKSVAASQNQREDGDGVEFESDSWSDDSGSDDLSRSLSNNSSKTWDAVSNDSSSDQDGSSPTKDQLGHLYLQYTETAAPYARVPLMEKISELARSHPAIMTLKSVDLSPASWMAVYWYPIYTIPGRKNVKDMEACFLTYHTLSSSFQDCGTESDDIDMDKEKELCCFSEWGSILEEQCKKRDSDCISLSPFGLATHKLQEDVWLNPEPYDKDMVTYLYSAADSWLKQLNVNDHHDFNFFTSNLTL